MSHQGTEESIVACRKLKVQSQEPEGRAEKELSLESWRNPPVSAGNTELDDLMMVYCLKHCNMFSPWEWYIDASYGVRPSFQFQPDLK